MRKSTLTSPDILRAIRAAAKSLGRPPSGHEFQAASGISAHQIGNHFATWNGALRAAGLPPHTKNLRLADAALLKEWASLARALGHIPTRCEYQLKRRHSQTAFRARFGSWAAIPAHFRAFAADKPEWSDVLSLLPPAIPAAAGAPSPASRGRPEGTRREPRRIESCRTEADRRDRGCYGHPLSLGALLHAPVNEQGVIFLFGMMAHDLGFRVRSFQPTFPDCEALRQTTPDRWERLRIEFEYESRNFRNHGHPAEGCDLIICWRHNWPECPKMIEVLELSTAINTLNKSGN
jgi:hypothetical protein